MLRLRTGDPLTLTPEGPARPYWTLTPHGVAWVAQRPPLVAERAKSTMRYCFYPRERLTVEPIKTVLALARCKCPTYPVLRAGEKTAREEREMANATHASPPPLKRRGLRR